MTSVFVADPGEARLATYDRGANTRSAADPAANDAVEAYWRHALSQGRATTSSRHVAIIRTLSQASSPWDVHRVYRTLIDQGLSMTMTQLYRGLKLLHETGFLSLHWELESGRRPRLAYLLDTSLKPYPCVAVVGKSRVPPQRSSARAPATFSACSDGAFQVSKVV